MLSLSEDLAKKVGAYLQIATDKDKPVFAITSNFLKCNPCITQKIKRINTNSTF